MVIRTTVDVARTEELARRAALGDNRHDDGKEH